MPKKISIPRFVLAFDADGRECGYYIGLEKATGSQLQQAVDQVKDDVDYHYGLKRALALFKAAGGTPDEKVGDRLQFQNA